MVEPGALCISREMPWKSTKIIYGSLRGLRLRTESTTRYNVEWAVLRDLQSERGELHLLYITVHHIHTTSSAFANAPNKQQQ